MGLVKPPSILTFILALIVGIAGVLAKFGVAVPVVGEHGFWLLLAGYLLLVMGCVFRGM